MPYYDEDYDNETENSSEEEDILFDVNVNS